MSECLRHWWENDPLKIKEVCKRCGDEKIE